VNRMLGDAVRLVTEFEFASERFLARKLRCAPHEAAGLIAALQALRIIGPSDGTGAYDVFVTARDTSTAAAAQPGPQPTAGGESQ
jgi:DNA segregation ATPase FtsK/SpoIIIE-like protein